MNHRVLKSYMTHETVFTIATYRDFNVVWENVRTDEMTPMNEYV